MLHPCCIYSATYVCCLYVAGWCTVSTAHLIKSSCPLSCGICGPITQAPTSIPCRDIASLCVSWKTSGECLGANKAFVQRQCPLSCNACASTNTPVTAAPAAPALLNCTDSNVKCRSWKNTGECIGASADFVKKECPLSCAVCSKLVLTPAPISTLVPTVVPSVPPAQQVYLAQAVFNQQGVKGTTQFAEKGGVSTVTLSLQGLAAKAKAYGVMSNVIATEASSCRSCG